MTSTPSSGSIALLIQLTRRVYRRANEDVLGMKLKAYMVLGNLRDTLPSFGKHYKPPPIGFVSIDVDLYSSTRDALKLFTTPGITTLWHVPLYFDDIEFIFNHRFGGELLAIDEFNAQHERFKIDRWYGVRNSRPFPERSYLDKMYVAHDLLAVSESSITRATGQLPLHA